MSEMLCQAMLNMAVQYSWRMANGLPLAEHEVLMYIQICRMIETYSTCLRYGFEKMIKDNGWETE